MICFMCVLSIESHSPNELRKCLKNLGVHQEKLNGMVEKLGVLIV